MAQELETALWCLLYSVPRVPATPINLLLESLTKQGKMPRMPKISVTPTVVTGIEALGRGPVLN